MRKHLKRLWFRVAEDSFASYHSRTEVKGNVIDYRRTFEVKELSV
jgi:hypothetical protein